MRWALVALLAAGLLVFGLTATSSMVDSAISREQNPPISEDGPAPPQISDAIAPDCVDYESQNRSELTNVRDLSLRIHDSRGWSTNLLGAFLESREPPYVIADDYKDSFLGQVDVAFDDGRTCSYEAEIRISGDLADHVVLDSGSVMSSLDVKLVTGYVGGVVRFKLFLPETRNSENEVFATEVLGLLGHLAPRTALVPISVNGAQYEVLFQEKLAKEMLEANGLRESALVEVDEEFYLTRPTNGDTRGVFARVSNAPWASRSITAEDVAGKAMDQLSRALAVARGESVAFALENILQPPFDREGLIDAASFRSAIMAMTGEHALFVHNRKFYFDPLRDRLVPVYYDGDIGTVQNIEGSTAFIDRAGWREAVNRNRASAEAIDVGQLRNRLEGLGVEDLSESEVRSQIQDVISGLDGQMRNVDNFPVSLPPPQVDMSPEAMYAAFDGFARGFRGVGRDGSAGWFYCEFPESICSKLPLDNDSLEDVLEGRHQRDGMPYKFVGMSTEKTGSDAQSEIRKIELEQGAFLEIVGAVSPSINFQTKTLRLEQWDSVGRAILTGGALEDWTIEFSGVGIDFASAEVESRFNSMLLTGCLTLQDMHVARLRIVIRQTTCEDGLNMMRINGNVESVVVDTSAEDALDADFSNVDFDELLVIGAGNDCIDLSGGKYRLSRLQTDFCGDKALSVGEGSTVAVNRFTSSNSVVGVASKDSSHVQIDSAMFTDVDLCGAAYRKKQEFSGASLSITNLKCAGTGVWVQEGSRYTTVK